MDIYTATEQAYKNGYVKGYNDGKQDSEVKTHCLGCIDGDPVSSPRERVWCNRMCRYMKRSGFCSEGEPKVG